MREKIKEKRGTLTHREREEIEAVNLLLGKVAVGKGVNRWGNNFKPKGEIQYVKGKFPQGELSRLGPRLRKEEFSGIQV